MRKLLLTLFAALFLATGFAVSPTPAYAAWNIVQKGDGTTVWRNSRNGQEIPIGGSVITHTLRNVAEEMTGFVAMPVDGLLAKVYTAISGTTAGSNTYIRFAQGNQNGWTEITDTNGITALIIASGATSGTMDSWTPGKAVSSHFTQGEVIAIWTDGLQTGDVDVTVTLVIRPR